MANTGSPEHRRQPVLHRRRAEGESLPNTYALFGQVTSGMNVVRRSTSTVDQRRPARVTQRILNVTIHET